MYNSLLENSAEHVIWFFSMEFVDPVNFKFDPKKRLLWVGSNFNQKKILKRTESFMMKILLVLKK